MVIVNFIRDRNVGIFARVKRPPRGNKTTSPAVEQDGGCAEERVLACQLEGGDNMRQRK
jgi:sphingolipid delta-4 desaturase